MKRKKTIALACIVLLTAAVLLAACGSQEPEEDAAFITISLGRDTGRTAVPWDTSVDDGEVWHDIYIDNNEVGTDIKIGVGVINYKVDPGSHTVSVYGYYPAGTLFSFGEKTVSVTAGQKAKCDITMLAALPPLSGNITISHSPGSLVNIPLTATYSGGETVSYQWKHGTTNVGTDSNTYTPTETGSFTVTVSAAGYSSKTSAAVTLYNAGTGSVSDPFIVCNVDTLSHVGNPTTGGYYDAWALDQHYKQMENIDLASVPDWTPIGLNTPVTSQFSGSYDGGGHTIRNLKITSATGPGVGLFGIIASGATVKNVGIVNCSITSSSGTAVGGVVGGNQGDTVENCYSTGTVTGTDNVGGVIGSAQVKSSYPAIYDVENCVALNPNVNGTGANVRRVAGGHIFGTSGGADISSAVINCYGRSDMTGNLAAYPSPHGATGLHGADITSTQWGSASWWTGTAGFDPDIWNIASGKLPTLKGMPEGEQNPEIK